MDTSRMVLLVEDDQAAAEAFTFLLESMGTKVYRVATFAELRDISQSIDFDAAVLDLFLPDSSGLDTFTKAKALLPNTPIVVVSGYANDDVAQMAIEEGAAGFIHKGSTTHGNSNLRSALKTALELRDTLVQMNKIQQSISGIRSAVSQHPENK